MTLQVKAVYRPLAQHPVSGFLSKFPQETEAAFAEVFPPIREALLADLRRIPARRFWTPEDWTSDKQRRAFHATKGFGGGIPHRRTNAIPAGWQADATVSGETITTVVRNPVPGAVYVYGSLAKTNPGRFQQRGHLRTGWPRGYDVATFWLNALREDLFGALRERLGDVVQGIEQRRAYTRTRRT